MKRFAALALMVAAPFLMGQREPVLVPEVSESRIEVRQGFTGADLLLYGAVIDPAGAGSNTEYDIVVVLKGPAEPIRLREKERVAGIWMTKGWFPPWSSPRNCERYVTPSRTRT